MDPSKESKTKSEEIKAKLGTSSGAKAEVAIVDVVFVCDCTGSMSSYMDKAKDTARQILNDIKATYTEASVFFGFVGYRDHCDTKLLEFMDLTGDVEEVVKFIQNLRADGGGDEAEAVVDALDYAAHKITWRPEALRQLIHILDAPPHGREFGGGDDHPNGCPCGLDYRQILRDLDKLGTEYMVLNFTNSVNSMVNIYKQYHSNIQCVPLTLLQPAQMVSSPCYPGAPPPTMDLFAPPSATPLMPPPPPVMCPPPPPPMPSIAAPPSVEANVDFAFNEDMMQQQQQVIDYAPSAPMMSVPMAAPRAAPMMYSGPAQMMSIPEQVTQQMAAQISTNVLTNVKKAMKKK